MIITIADIYFFIILLFPIFTLFQGYIDWINRFIFVLLFFAQIVLFPKRIRKKSLYVIAAMIINYLYSVFLTLEKPDNLNDFFYYPFAIIFLLYMGDNIEIIGVLLKRNRRMVHFILNTWSFLMLISLFLPSSYTIEWGGARYFGSYCKTVFRFAPTCIFIMSLSLCAMVCYNKRKYFFYALLPLVTIYMGGSRTYLLVGIALFMMLWYYYLLSPKAFFLSVLPIFAILFILIFLSPMANKILATKYNSTSHFDFWGTISNGRTVFWLAEIKAFIDCGFFEKLFGNGFNYIYDVNQRAIGSRIWAHDDFLNLLLSNGLVGLSLYLFSIKELLKNRRIKKEGTVGSFVPAIGCFMVWFLNAMLNMFYTYFCSLLAFPFLVFAVRKANGFNNSLAKSNTENGRSK